MFRLPDGPLRRLRPVRPSSPLRRPAALLTAFTLAALLAGCASGPAPSKRAGGYYEDDGPGSSPPADAARVPDAEPRVEPFSRGTMRPYTVLGRSYTPITEDRAFRQRGIASWYGRKFHGKRTASGETYDMYAMTAAHPTLPIPSYVRVRHVASGREVVVRVNDRGPFHANRIIDLSYAAALKLGFVTRGSAEVEIERITHDEIRAGTWRQRGGDSEPVRVAQADAVDAAPAPAPSAPPAPALPAAPVAAVPAPPPAVAPAAPQAAVPAPQPATRVSAVAPGFWVQLGAFRQRDGAESFHRRVAGEAGWLSPLLSILDDAPLFRLQAGPYATRDEAASIAERVREALKLVPLVVER